jgi:hypothetical protein
MVLGLLLMAGLPTAVGVTTGVAKAGGNPVDEEREAEMGKESRLSVYCDLNTARGKKLHGKPLLLSKGKIVVGVDDEQQQEQAEGMQFKGFFNTFPTEDEDPKPRGFVCVGLGQPPEVGFLYIDRDTSEIKYGNRSTSTPHIHGSWNMTEDGENILLEEEELFVAVKGKTGVWSLYWDKNDDGSAMPTGRPAIPVSIERKVIDTE